MNRKTKAITARTAAMGLVFVAATVIAAPGWATDQEQKPDPKQEVTLQAEPKAEERKIHQKKKGAHKQRRDQRGAAVRVARILGRELRLSPEQSESVRDLLRQNAEALRSNAREIGETRRALREQVLADSADEAAIKSASERLGASIGSSSVLFARIAAAVRPPLSPEQRKRLRKTSGRWEARQDRWRERVEHWNGD